jgi:RNA recognition motif-containing protein
MSTKVESRTPTKDTRGPGDHRRESGGGRNDRGGRSHSHNRSESRDRSKRDHDHESKDNKDAGQNDDKGDAKSEEKKFTGRCRLFVGNLTPGVSEDEFKNMFTPFGEVSEAYVNASRGFGFIRLVRIHTLLLFLSMPA